jgi:hypothetical protein
MNSLQRLQIQLMLSDNNIATEDTDIIDIK